MIFFFSSYVDHLDLHSFPTRRSSDLSGTPCEDVVRGELCHYPTGVARRFPDDKPLVEWSIESYLGDRKSTRLNSSHTVISYAVFCLKKKKKKQKKTQHNRVKLPINDK